MTYLERLAAILSETSPGGTDGTERSLFVHPSVGSVGAPLRGVSRGDALSEANSDNHSERPAEISSVAASPAHASFFDHHCSACGQPARFGYGVYLRRGGEGRWFCAAHRPETGRA